VNLSAGKLRHRVDIQVYSENQDPVTGAVQPVWTDIHYDVPCSIEPLSVKDMMQSQALQSDVSVRVSFRYLNNLTDSMRLVGRCGCHHGQVFNPAGYFEDITSGRSYITAPCSRGVNDGDG